MTDDSHDSQPLARDAYEALAGETFDLVVSALVLHYLADWGPTLAEFRRILKPGGRLVFSTGHPIDELRFSAHGRYFEPELVRVPWRGFGGEPVLMPWYRFPLTMITEWVYHAGFVIERLIEPQPTAEFQRADPDDYAHLLRQPGFLCIRARAERR